MSRDKAKYNAYLRKYMLQRYYRRKQEAVDKLGGKCSCGSVENLEFDHIDPETKCFTMGKAFTSMAKHKIEAELEKCQLLCKPCHDEKSKAEGSFVTRALPLRHGKLYTYNAKGCRCEPCRSAKRQSRTN